MLTEQDLKQIKEKGISAEKLENQLEQFKTGFPFLKLEAAAGIGRGIMAPDESSPSSMSTHGKPIRAMENVW